MKKYLLIVMLLMIAACSGPSDKNSCIPSRDQSQQTTLSGEPQADAEGLDSKLEEAKIISTLVDRIKETVVGGAGSFSGAEQLFTGFVQSQTVQMGVTAAFLLYVMIFGILVLGGMIQATVGEVVIRVIKVAFISIFAL